DDVDFSVWTGRRVDPRPGNRHGEDVVLVGVENGLFALTWPDAKDASIATGTGPKRPVGRTREAPDLRRRGRQYIRQPGSRGNRAVSIDQHTVRRAFQQLGRRADNPKGRTRRAEQCDPADGN